MALVGIYDADGGIVGELKYAYGKVRGRAHCALCDITHGYNPLGKTSWKQALAESAVKIKMIHRNHADAAQLAAAKSLPCLLKSTSGGDAGGADAGGDSADGNTGGGWEEVVSSEELATFVSDPAALLKRLESL